MKPFENCSLQRGCVIAAALLGFTAFVQADDVRDEIQFRRPIAVAPAGDESVVVANRDSGSLSIIDPADWSVVAEQRVGERLSDVTAIPDAGLFVALDEAAGEAILFEIEQSEVRVADRLPAGRSPVSASVTSDRRTVAIASLWDHTLVLCNLDPDARTIRRRTTILLPFAPRHQIALPDGERVLVCDAFGGRLALVDVQSDSLESLREIPAHNIRGLAVSPSGRDLYVAHQLLNTRAPTTFDSIHWGDLVENLIRIVPVEALLDADSDLVEAGRVIQFGSTGGGAGDPAGIAFTSDGRLVAVASGVDRAHVFPVLHGIIAPTIQTGRMPTDVAVLRERDQAVIVNTLGDSLSVVDTSTGRLVRELPLGPTPAPGPRERGESLFFDARLSHDAWLSCHSCHTDGHANGLLADTHADGTFGTPKKILSLLGTRDNNPWAWNGSLRTLHEQVTQSVESSMQGQLTPGQANDLVSYLHTLPPAPPIRPVAASAEDENLLQRGPEVFASQGCAHCHVPPLTYTSDHIVEVGLTDEQGLTKFNPPSLRGVSQQYRFLHDGRAATLRSVFEDHGHQLPQGLTAEETDALVRFLESL